MYKKSYPYSLPIATDYKGRGEFPAKVPRILAESPYYQSCSEAFDKKDAIIPTPYAAAYDAATTKGPAYGKGIVPSFNGGVAAAASATASAPSVEKRYFKKRILPLLLILILALVGLAVPIVSSLQLVEDYVNIDVDILDIADIFSNGFSLEVITDNIPLIALAVFLLLSLILVIKALIAVLGKKKRGFAILAILTFIVAAVFVTAMYEFDFEFLFADIDALDYGFYALIGCPLLVFLLSLFAYKKLN